MVRYGHDAPCSCFKTHRHHSADKPSSQIMNHSKITGIWNVGKNPAPAVISNNNFVHKSLSEWALNFAVGCAHGCRYCYVPSSSLNKQAEKLGRLGVQDPDAQFGDYVFLRPWDEDAFLSSLRSAEKRPAEKLTHDGNRAVMLCTTTDAYQVVPDPQLHAHLRMMVRRSLELIRDYSSINVRILTRSPLVREDFDLLKSLGSRVMLGLSIPTLRNDLARVYEPAAPAPTQRLRVLQEAASCGIPTFVAIAPVFPECDDTDIRNTVEAVAKTDVATIFAEPVNIRAQNVGRIQSHAAQLGVQLNTDVFRDDDAWQSYAIKTLKTVESIAEQLGVRGRLHLWPDATLGTKTALRRLPQQLHGQHLAWLHRYWNRVSEWPTAQNLQTADGFAEVRPFDSEDYERLSLAFNQAKEMALDFIDNANRQLPSQSCPQCGIAAHVPGIACPVPECGYVHNEPWLVLKNTEHGVDVVHLTNRKHAVASFNVEA